MLGGRTELCANLAAMTLMHLECLLLLLPQRKQHEEELRVGPAVPVALPQRTEWGTEPGLPL